MMRSRGARTIAFLSALLWAGGAVAADPTAVVRETIDRVVEILQQTDSTRDEKLRNIESLSEERFNFSLMSKLVLGRYRKKLSEAQSADFLAEFRKHLSLTYGRRLMDFSDEKIEIGEARTEAKGDVTVSTKIVGGAAGDGVALDYRLRERDADWKVIDVIIEGVSLVSNFRSQVQEIVTEKGADQLIEMLREKNSKEAKAS
jgi:phospholipid transport system substrate-binding protein